MLKFTLVSLCFIAGTLAVTLPGHPRMGGAEGGSASLGALLLDAQLEDPAQVRTHRVLLGLLADGVSERSDPLQAVADVLEDDPAASEVRFALSFLLVQRQRHAEAEEQLERVVGARPDDAAAFSALGACRIQTGRPAAAIEPLERSLALQPTREAAWRLRQALVLTGQTGRAHDALSLFLSLDRGPPVN